jgi:hypothetical protein
MPAHFRHQKISKDIKKGIRIDEYFASIGLARRTSLNMAFVAGLMQLAL